MPKMWYRIDGRLVAHGNDGDSSSTAGEAPVVSNDTKAGMNDQSKRQKIKGPKFSLPPRGITKDEEISHLPAFVQGVQSSDPTLQEESTKRIRELLSIERSPPIQKAIDYGVFPRLIEFLRCDSRPALQFEAAWALTNVANGTDDQVQYLVDCGVVPEFVRLLGDDSDEEVRDQGAWGLGNVSGISSHFRDVVLRAGAMPPLLEQITKSNVKLSFLRNTIWTVSNLCRGKPQPDFCVLRSVLPVLFNILQSNQDKEVLADACWAISYISEGNNEKKQAVVDSNVCPYLIKLLTMRYVQSAALVAVANVASGNNLQKQILIDHGILPNIHTLLSTPSKGINKEICRMISSFMAGNQEQIEAVLNCSIVPHLVRLCESQEPDVAMLATKAIVNGRSNGSTAQVKRLIEQGASNQD